MASVSGKSGMGIPSGARITCIHATIAKNGVIFTKSFTPKKTTKGFNYIPDSEPRLCESVADAARYFADCIKGLFTEEKPSAEKY
jgi:hypothetical protein